MQGENWNKHSWNDNMGRQCLPQLHANMKATIRYATYKACKTVKYQLKMYKNTITYFLLLFRRFYNRKPSIWDMWWYNISSILSQLSYTFSGYVVPQLSGSTKHCQRYKGFISKVWLFTLFSLHCIWGF